MSHHHWKKLMSMETTVGCFTIEGKPEAGSDGEAGRGSVLLGQEDNPTVFEQEVCSAVAEQEVCFCSN